MERPIVKIEGTQHIYTLQQGEQFTIYKGFVIVTHPDKKPRIIDSRGVIQELDISVTGTKK